MNCTGKAMKICHLNPNQSGPSIYIIIEVCYFSLDQWEIRIHLLYGKSFNIPHHCDPHLNQTKFNDILPLTIHDVLEMLNKQSENIVVLSLIRYDERSSRVLHSFHWWGLKFRFWSLPICWDCHEGQQWNSGVRASHRCLFQPSTNNYIVQSKPS